MSFRRHKGRDDLSVVQLPLPLLRSARCRTWVQFYAWAMKNVRRFEQPIAYKHPAGAVIWVTLTDANVAGGVAAISN